ncbi:MAG: sulfatase-like hydrolase/transferase [Gemmatales bacterium]|nr:sulfatase-like hydrolase/transferase [Gemmatales bacterium]MDW8386588.1 sulfatase-like hydrolase/transferase [Gemmatales bacterium]
MFRHFILAVTTVLLAVSSVTAAGTARPNFLWLIAEDLGPDLSCYGNSDVQTPHLDRLASEGMRFQFAFVTCPVCSPSRSAIMTGMYQTTIDAHNHRSHRDDGHRLPEGVRLLTHWMKDAGYFTANLRELPEEWGFRGIGKTDFNFFVEGRSCDTDRWADLKSHQPFFAQINFHETHRPFPRTRQTPPEKVHLPPYYPDHPVARADWAAYLDALIELDRKVGRILDGLKRDGLADNTVVVFFADNGPAHVRAKQFCYDSGLRVPLILRWPKSIPAPSGYAPGRVDTRLVELIDLAPTLLALAGADKPARMQGRVILGDRQDPPRQYAFGARDRCDETIFRFRTVRDARYRYIRNFTPDRPFLQANRYKETSYPVWNLLKTLHAEGKLTPIQAVLCAPTMPEEELYDLDHDPHETANLANDPALAEVKARLKDALERWTEETQDRGRLPEPEFLAANQGVRWPGNRPNFGYTLADEPMPPPIQAAIPKAKQAVVVDGHLDEWSGALAAPVHVGHPDWSNRGGEFLLMWDENHLYVGQRCLDQQPAHVGRDDQIWNGDAVEFYLDTRQGDQLGKPDFAPGTLHMFWTPFTRSEVKPRIQVRPLPAFKDLRLDGVEVAARKTAWGYTAEFKLPWRNFAGFAPKAGVVLGLDLELCSSDGGPRSDRTFVWTGPASVGSPSAFARIQLVDELTPAHLQAMGPTLLPAALNQSANYPWLYGTVGVSTTIAGRVARIEGHLLDASGKVRKTASAVPKTDPPSGLVLWRGAWELFDVPEGRYWLDLVARDAEGKEITRRRLNVVR